MRVIPVNGIEIDVTGHPTENGTINILKEITDEMEEPIIWNEKFRTTQKPYKGVQALYRYGCKTCWTFGQFKDNGFCTTCYAKNLQYKETEELNTIKEYYKRNLDNKSVKRSNEDNIHDDSVKKGKI